MRAQSSRRKSLLETDGSDGGEADADTINKEPQWMIIGGGRGQIRVSTINSVGQLPVSKITKRQKLRNFSSIFARDIWSLKYFRISENYLK